MPVVPGKFDAVMMPMREPAASRRAPLAGLRSRNVEAPPKFAQSAIATLAGAITRYCAVTVLEPLTRAIRMRMVTAWSWLGRSVMLLPA